ncbi:MAG: hypothetical protein RLP14_09670 [Owenweeksia sp.]
MLHLVLPLQSIKAMGLTSDFKKIRFFETLQPLLGSYGYEFMPLLNQFRKTSRKGYCNIIIYPTIYPERIFFEVSFGSRINIVERTLLPYVNGVKGFSEDGNTAITNLKRFLSQPQFTLTANNGQQLKEVIRFISDFFENGGFDYLESLTDIHQLDRLMNMDFRDKYLFSGNPVLHCFRGITVATLNANPNWNELYQGYVKYMESLQTPRLIQENFNRLVFFLSDMGLN